MEIGDEEIQKAIHETSVLRFPKHSLATFGTTNVDYFLLTTPVYAHLATTEETVIREGKVSAARPQIVTPSYLAKLEGFGEHAKKYLDYVTREHGPDAPGLLYTYKNESRETSVVSDGLEAVAGRLSDRIDKEGNKMTAIIRGVDELWDVSLLKFISELTESSVRSNIAQLGSRGLLDMDRAGVPREARYRIELLFHQVESGERDPTDLKRELERWDLFGEYEDRFFSLFRR